MDFQKFGRLDVLTFGRLDVWTIERLDFWTFGRLDVIQPNKIKTLIAVDLLILARYRDRTVTIPLLYRDFFMAICFIPFTVPNRSPFTGQRPSPFTVHRPTSTVHR